MRGEINVRREVEPPPPSVRRNQQSERINLVSCIILPFLHPQKWCRTWSDRIQDGGEEYQHTGNIPEVGTNNNFEVGESVEGGACSVNRPS